jgi:hypothetical protein
MVRRERKMTQYTVRAPDGKTITLDGPPGASQADVIAQAQKLYKPQAASQPAPAAKDPSGYFSGMDSRMHGAINAAEGQLGSDFRSAYGPQPKGAPSGAGNPGGARAGAADRLGGDILDVLKSPFVGAVSGATGLDRQSSDVITSGLSMLLGARGGAAGEAGAAEKAASGPRAEQAAMDAEHAGRVSRLQRAGVEMTPGQKQGGLMWRAEEAHKSNPFVGQGIRDAENHSIRTFNKATYDKVLSPIGEKYTGSAQDIGRAGVRQVQQKLNAAYDRLKPRMKLSWDDKLTSDLAGVRSEAAELPPDHERQFETILNNRVLKPLTQGHMDGETFKKTEEAIGKLAAQYKGSQDPAQRALGQRLEDVNGALRDGLERGSDASVRGDLKRVNNAYAMFTRVRGAAANRAGSGGVFSTGDLLSAIKQGDKTVGKGAFARGDALLQDWAEDAHQVLPNRLPDSGTAERLAFNKPQGLVEAGVGGVTNPMTRKALQTMGKKELPKPAPSPQAAGPIHVLSRRTISAAGAKPGEGDRQ